MAKKTPPKTDTLSSQVLEYFRKYSGDQNLSSYLRGVLPQQQQESEVRNTYEENKPDDFIVGSQNNSKIDQTIEREGNISPTSSLTSNRKLEWDNGADIGYENSNKINLHKSFSLPTLLTTLETTENPLKLPLLESKRDASPKIYFSSTESSDKSIKPSSSSSYYRSDEQEHKCDTTTSSSFAFKPWPSERDKRVGSPMAQSTPNIDRPGYKRVYSSDSPSTVVSNVTKSDDNNGLKTTVTELKCVAKFKKSKIIQLALTKPIAIDCINYKLCNDKDIQTNGCVKSESIGIQTEPFQEIINNKEDFSKKLEHIEELVDKPEKQVVEYVKYDGNSSECHSSKSIGTNTISDLVSNCNSFEFLCPDDIQRVNKNLEENDLMDDEMGGTDKTCFKENLKDKNSNQNSEKSLSTPLGDMISCNLSGGRNVDIEKSLTLLKRLLKSKRYDKITKEYFIKKIIEKMVKLNSSSSESSLLNNQNDSNKSDAHKNNENSSSSKEVSEKLLEPSLNTRLHENVPWVQGAFNKNVTSKKLEIKTFSSDIFPENNQIKRKVKDPRFTLTNSVLNQPQTNSSSDNNQKNWKENLTQPEKLLFELNSKGDGDKTNKTDSNTDSLVKFAKKERENQLNWINNEISHLNKLKELLQKNYYERSLKKEEKVSNKNDNDLKNDDFKNESPNLEIEILTKPHIEDMKKIKNSAAVYMITTDKSRHHKDKQRKDSNSRKNSDVREAKMVSSEVYKSDKPFTCIRRYIFEIPVECECDCDKYPCAHINATCTQDICGCSETEVGVQPERVIIKETYLSPSRLNISQNRSRLIPGVKEKSKNVNDYDYYLDPPEEFRDKNTQRSVTPPRYDEAYDKSTMPKRGYEYASKYSGQTRDNNQQIPLKEDSFDKASMTQQCSCDRGVQCCCTTTRVASPQTDIVQTRSIGQDCRCKSKDCLFDKGVQCLCQKMVASPQTSLAQTISRSIEPDTIFEKPKDKSDFSFGTNTDDRYRRQSVDFSSTAKNKSPNRSIPTYSKSTPEYQTDYKQYASEPQKRNYQRSQKRNVRTPSSSSSSSSQTILIKICPCCKQKTTPVNKAINKYRTVLQGLPDEINESLCQPCHLNTKLTVDPTTGEYKMAPGHICNCYTLMRTQTVNKIKQTVKKLEELEHEATEESRCSCSKKKCRCKTVGRSKKGIAYTLTLEDDEYTDQESPKKKRSLDEIKLKIPVRRKKSKHSRRHKKRDKSSDRSRMTLQDYLCTNRPAFIQNAEDRRKTLIELAYLREERCQKYKQLLAKMRGVVPDEEGNKKTKKGLYSSVEMKEITAKNYKKLPEVQNKLKERRENNNKKANRLLADMFNKKVQQNALKGNVHLSTTSSVIKFI
ncbi:titin homolog isoform X1 [Onthophagus taurus]|uniref:titin homolog isoform X1 n=1 Tax=Onthophagus taurus TaxID=166361 RepID=UPI0039BE6D8C